MESHGVPGRVCVSERAHGWLKEYEDLAFEAYDSVSEFARQCSGGVHTTNRPDLRIDEDKSSPQGPSKLMVEDVDDATDEQLSTSTPQERSALPAESTQGR